MGGAGKKADPSTEYGAKNAPYSAQDDNRGVLYINTVWQTHVKNKWLIPAKSCILGVFGSCSRIYGETHFLNQSQICVTAAWKGNPHNDGGK